MEQGFDLGYYWSVVKRRSLALFLTAVAVFAIVAAVAYLLPPVYGSTARILVESQQIPSELAQSTVTVSALERVQLIEQRLMTRSNLLQIIDKFGLFSDRSDMTTTEKVEKMRASTTFEQIEFGDRRRRGAPSATAFTISFQAESPTVSARVTNEFVTLMLEQNIQSRTARASETYSFFEKEVERLSNELIKLESEILTFKGENGEALPDSLEYRRNELLTTQERLLALDRQISTLRDQQEYLRKLVASGANLPVSDASMTEDERLLQALNREVAQQRTVYSETHPKIKALRSRIAALEKTVAEAAALRAGNDPTGEAAALLNPAEQRLGQMERELSLLEEQHVAMTERQAKLEKSISDTPRVEIALNVLTRNYADLEQQYQEARTKLADAATGERLETNRQAERFEVIEQATVPDAPDKPNRPLILLGGFFGSFGVGLAMVILLEMMDSSIRRPQDIEARLELRPLAVVPFVRTPSEMRRSRRRFWLILLVVIGLIATAIAAVHIFYLPVDLLFQKAMEKAEIDGLIELVKSRLGM